MKKILVTGGSRGIGFNIAKKLAEEGHEVTITGRNPETLAMAAEKIKAKNFMACDLTEKIELKEIPDVLINNAGAYAWHPIEKNSPEETAKVLKINLEVPIELCSLVVPEMKKRSWGRIINIGSISGAVGEANASVYSASKAGLIGLTKSLALELAEHGITVNIVNPGWVKTDMTAEVLDEEILQTIPQKRYIEPLEIADLVSYLISDSARGITGQAINMCCGLSLG